MTNDNMVNLLDKLIENRTLPDGYDSWGIKSVLPDLRTRNDFRWPFPGNETDRYPLDDHSGSCPKRPGDGLCVATTWAGMASGGFPARTLLLVSYRASESRGNESGKFRVPQCFVVDVIDGEDLLRKFGRGANLRGANLRGANLRNANLQDANLRGADLQYAYLQDANLRNANLPSADLQGVNLRGANLRGANLRGANLQYAYLQDAYLQDANLQSADLQDANLRNANLRNAYLQDANLRNAYLQYADLQGADLQGADLQYANLQGAYLHGHNIDLLKQRGAITA